MTRKHQGEPKAPGRGRYAVLLALIIFAALGSSPELLAALHMLVPAVPSIPSGAPTTSRGVHLLPAPAALPPVALPRVALPIDPGQQPASPAKVNATTQAAEVNAEDDRIRILLHDSATLYRPHVVPIQGSLPTLVLTGSYTDTGFTEAPTGSATYTYADLVRDGALLPLANHAALLVDNVFAATNAHLDLGSPGLSALYLSKSSGGFASIVAWGGSLEFMGTARQPLTIMGWDRAANSPATDTGAGRPYIREVGGRMDLTDVRVSSLGFWSGRTGGVSWTGTTSQPSTGDATSSTFTGDTYGAFVTRGHNVMFHDDLFEFNELDGLHIHRNTVGTLVSASSAARNGGNGFLVDRATSGTVFTGVLSQHNAGDGFLVDGRPLVTGASASGGSVAVDTGTYVEHSAALDNAGTGILLEGGMGTVLRSNEICTHLTGIAIRYGASNTVVTGNDIRCGARAALEIGPAAPQTMVSGNALVNARIGMLVRSSGHLEADNNRITGATVFGITARGGTSQVTGQGNVISGIGFRAVDARADAAAPALSGTQDAGWAHHVTVNFWSYLRFHPLAMLWFSILILVIGGEIWSRIRRMPSHPYPASTHWRPTLAGRRRRAPAGARAGLALAEAMAGGRFRSDHALVDAPGTRRAAGPRPDPEARFDPAKPLPWAEDRLWNSGWRWRHRWLSQWSRWFWRAVRWRLGLVGISRWPLLVVRLARPAGLARPARSPRPARFRLAAVVRGPWLFRPLPSFRRRWLRHGRVRRSSSPRALTRVTSSRLPLAPPMPRSRCAETGTRCCMG